MVSHPGITPIYLAQCAVDKCRRDRRPVRLPELDAAAADWLDREGKLGVVVLRVGPGFYAVSPRAEA